MITFNGFDQQYTVGYMAEISTQPTYPNYIHQKMVTKKEVELVDNMGQLTKSMGHQ